MNNYKIENFYSKKNAYSLRMADKNNEFWRSIFSNFVKDFSQFIDYKEKNFNILDVGCGAGISTNEIAQKFPNSKIVGIDINEYSIDVARTYFPSIQFDVGSVLNLPYDNNSFDIVVSYAMLEHIPDVKRALFELNRVLNKDGFLIISTPNMLSPFRNLNLFLKNIYKKDKHPDGKISSIIKSFYLLYNKSKNNEVEFLYREPVLEDSVFLGSDFDAIYLSNPFDLKKWAELNHYRILNLFGASSLVGRMVKKILPFFSGGVLFVALKNGNAK